MTRFEEWVRALEARHLSELRLSEVSRALRALSSTYVERRDRIREGGALSGAGKRAAFALFYGPLHYLIVEEVLKGSPGALLSGRAIVDLGCGTGAASAAWASALSRPPTIVAVDRHPWAVREASWTYRTLGLKARCHVGDATTMSWPRGPSAFLLAYVVNELDAAQRERLLGRLLERIGQGDAMLIVEPLAGFVAPWWSSWRESIEAAGGHANEWRVGVARPEIVLALERAAGLDYRELKARSLWHPGRSGPVHPSRRLRR
jgi:SAM-dependent methyltransferase